MHSETKYVPIDDSSVDELDTGRDRDDLETNLDELTGLSKNLTKKESFANQLVGELPRCPECSKILKKRTLPRCDYCGFSFSYLEKLFPMDQLPALELVLDFSNRLSPDETERIKEATSFLQKRYPQLIPKVCLLPLQPEVQVHQMALWMINQCPPATGEKHEDKDWYVLLLIDTSKNKSALAYGYKAEIYIPDESSVKLVSLLNRSLNKDKIDNEIVDLFNELVSILDGTKRMLKKLYKKFKRTH